MKTIKTQQCFKRPKAASHLSETIILLYICHFKKSDKSPQKMGLLPISLVTFSSNMSEKYCFMSFSQPHV